MKYLALSALFSLLVNGLSPRTLRTMSYEANFDDRLVNPIAPANPVGIYNALRYKAWVFDQTLVNLAPGVPPRSPKNAIATARVTSQTLEGTPTLTVDYPGSTIKYFDLQSFYFGCVLPLAQSDGNVATQCSILVAGFDAQNKEKAHATYTFTPTVGQINNAPMIQAILPSDFTGLYNATIVQSSPLTQVLKLDNVKYKTYST